MGRRNYHALAQQAKNKAAKQGGGGVGDNLKATKKDKNIFKVKQPQNKGKKAKQVQSKLKKVNKNKDKTQKVDETFKELTTTILEKKKPPPPTPKKSPLSKNKKKPKANTKKIEKQMDGVNV